MTPQLPAVPIDAAIGCNRVCAATLKLTSGGGGGGAGSGGRELAVQRGRGGGGVVAPKPANPSCERCVCGSNLSAGFFSTLSILLSVAEIVVVVPFA